MIETELSLSGRHGLFTTKRSSFTHRGQQKLAYTFFDQLMKHLLLAIFLGVLSAGTHAAEPLTAAELATHLGIVHWKTKVDLPSGSFSVSIAEIKDGKGMDTNQGSLSGIPGDPEGQKVMVMASEDESGTTITLLAGISFMKFKCFEEKPIIAIMRSHSLPDKLTAGDYVLGGDYITRNGAMPMTGKVEDVKRGLLLKIVPNSAKPAK